MLKQVLRGGLEIGAGKCSVFKTDVEVGCARKNTSMKGEKML